jgi:hypothetical protein
VDYVGFYPAHPMPGKMLPAILKVVKKMVERGLSVKYVFTVNGCTSGGAKARVDEYKQQAQEMGIKDNIIFMNDYPEWVSNVDYDTVQKLWKITNLFIMPSLSETTSLMLLEAMAHRCLIIANENFPLYKEILGNGAIYHQFGTHQMGEVVQTDEMLSRLVDLIQKWYKDQPSLYVLNRIKRTYSEESIYQMYLPLFEDQEIVYPKISVVIPIMNVNQELVDFTKKSIESVKTYPNTELVLVNNYPEDVTEYGADVVITNPENVGVSRAWNQGIAKATGEYVMVLNSDVFLPENWGERMMGCGNNIGFPWNNRCEGEGQGLIPDERFKFPDIHGCCFIAKRETFNKIGPFDERFFAYYEDRDYWHRAVLAGVHACRVNIKVTHAMNATSGKLSNLGEIIESSAKKFKEKWSFNG